MFSFRTALEKAQEKEIEFLRNEVKELRIQLIAVSGNAAQYWNAKLAEQRTSKNHKEPVDSLVEKIKGVEAKTPEEKQKQTDAIKITRQILGGH